MKRYEEGQVFDHNSTEVPECPTCKKGTERVHLDSERTTIGALAPPCVITKDSNITFSRYKCNECGARYKVKTQYGEQQGETILLN